MTADEPKSRQAQAILILGLCLTGIAYAATLRFGFVFDDIPQIVRNPVVQSWRYAPGYFNHHLWAQVQGAAIGNFYRPLFSLWLLLNFTVFGLHPAGWHAASLALHLLATWLTWAVARRVMGNDVAGATTALIFGLHPVHIESVAWISGATDSLLAVCFLGSFACYLRARECERWSYRWWTASLLLFALALLAKEPAMVLPALVFATELLLPRKRSLPALDGDEKRGPKWDAARRAAPITALYCAVLAAYLAVRIAVLHGFSNPMTGVSLRIQFLTWPSLLWFYARHLVWPLGISEFYETPYVLMPTSTQFIGPLVVMLALAAGLTWWWRRSGSPVVALASLWLLLPLVPALKIDTYQYGELAHDRYLYLPCLGFAMLLVLAIGNLRFGEATLFRQPAMATVALLTVVCGYGVATASQSLQWANALQLYARGFQVAPNNVHVVASLATELVQEGRYQDAIPWLERATRMAPTDSIGYFLLAYNYYRLGRYVEAEPNFIRAAQLDPRTAAPLYFLALSRLAMHRNDEAEAPLRRAIELLPAGKGFHQALARALAGRGDIAGARTELATELTLDPGNDDARAQLAALHEAPSPRGMAGTAAQTATNSDKPRCSVVGDLEIKPFTSSIFHNTRMLRVWLPPGYRSPENRKQRYPVLYLNDGQNVFDACTSIFNPQEWRADETATELVRSGKIVPLIIVGIDNAGKRERPNEYLAWPDDTLNPPMPAVHGKSYPEFLFSEVMPFINREYRTRTEAADTALGGSSYGAGIALYAAIQRPGRIGKLLLESPSLYADNDHLLHDAELLTRWPQRVFVGVGTVSEPEDDVRRLADILRKHGLKQGRLMVVVQPGAAHNEDAWAARFPGALQFLFGKP